MRLIDLLEEGLKRSMDKLKEKERDKVIQGLMCISLCCDFCLFVLLIELGRSQSIYNTLLLLRFYCTVSLFHELLNIYFENTVLAFTKHGFSSLLMWHSISASYW